MQLIPLIIVAVLAGLSPVQADGSISQPLPTTFQTKNLTTLSSSSLRGSNSKFHQSTSSLKNHSSATPSLTKQTLISLPLVPHRVRYNATTTSTEEEDDENEDRRRRHNRRLDRPAQPYIPLNEQEEDPQEQLLSSARLYQGYGTHYVDLWIGTPPQRQTVIVDTGSGLTAFPCNECQGCGTGYHVDSYFDETKSTSFHLEDCTSCHMGKCLVGTTCDIGVSYQEGSSWRAVEAVDTVYAGGPHEAAIVPPPDDAFPLVFGCQTHLTGLFKTQLADGIMGMELSESSYWHQMYARGVLREASFSLCLSRQPTAERQGTEAGALVFGGSDERLHETHMVYAQQMNPNHVGWFVVRLKKVYLRLHGGERVQVPPELLEQEVVVNVDISEELLNSGNVILDSGTTDTYLPSALAKPFANAWHSLMGWEYHNNALTLTHEELMALPTVLFQLQVSVANDNSDAVSTDKSRMVAGELDPARPTDVIVAMPSTHYMEYKAKTQTYTSRLYLTERHGGVLGANFMMGHDVHFDTEQQQVGFAESNCEYAHLVENEE